MANALSMKSEIPLDPPLPEEDPPVRAGEYIGSDEKTFTENFLIAVQEAKDDQNGYSNHREFGSQKAIDWERAFHCLYTSGGRATMKSIATACGVHVSTFKRRAMQKFGMDWREITSIAVGLSSQMVYDAVWDEGVMKRNPRMLELLAKNYLGFADKHAVDVETKQQVVTIELPANGREVDMKALQKYDEEHEGET